MNNQKAKLAARILAGALAALMVLGTITMTIMYLLSDMTALGGLPM